MSVSHAHDGNVCSKSPGLLEIVAQRRGDAQQALGGQRVRHADSIGTDVVHRGSSNASARRAVGRTCTRITSSRWRRPVAVFPTFFCGGAVPEMTSTTSSLELQDLPPAVTGVPSPDFSVNSDSDDSSSDKVRPILLPLSARYPYRFPTRHTTTGLSPPSSGRRNERERQRVRHVNDGFERLRSRLPLPPRDKDRRLSKVETLRYAISYIRHLQRLLGLIDDDDDDEDCENSRCHR
ncbi:hypothetical protein MRX96_024422 [Rhipicephalus microplus]